jgi:alkylation response protein AidB-like acyl-CoA dehydrogenase
MDFRLSEEHIFLQSTIRTFVSRECPRESINLQDEDNAFPVELLAKLGSMGLCALNLPEVYGGGGQDLLGTSLVIEEIAAMSPVLAGLFANTVLYGGQVIAAMGTSEQHERWLPQIGEGKLVFGCHPMSASGIEAYQDQAGYILNGTTPLISLLEHADFLIVSAGLDVGDDRQIACFVVPANADGVHLRRSDMVGWRGAGSGTIYLEDVHVGVENILGGPGGSNQGETQVEAIKAIQHLAEAAIKVGLAQGAIDYTANYASERAQFGRPIVSFEAIEHMLVDLTVDLHSTRWLLRHACWKADQDLPYAFEAASACLQALNLSRQAGLKSVHILGGYGYMAEYDAERYFRDSLVLYSVNEGSVLLKSEIGRLAGLKENVK